MRKLLLCLIPFILLSCSSNTGLPDGRIYAIPKNSTETKEFWRGIEIAPEYRCTPYNRDDYRYPQSVEPKIVEIHGQIYSPYTGQCFDSLDETDIEHIIALSEAHDSGLCAANLETRRRFASDLLNLTLAAPFVNRYQKKHYDAAEWMPVLNQCWFANQNSRNTQKI